MNWEEALEALGDQMMIDEEAERIRGQEAENRTRIRREMNHLNRLYGNSGVTPLHEELRGKTDEELRDLANVTCAEVVGTRRMNVNSIVKLITETIAKKEVV